MDYKKLTVYFIIAIALVIAGYDAWVIKEGGVEASISYTMISWSYSFPAFTFLMGFVAGHLFWVIRARKPDAKIIDSNTSS